MGISLISKCFLVVNKCFIRTLYTPSNVDKNASCRTRTPEFQDFFISLNKIKKGFIWPKASTPKPGR